ncbi:MAG: amidoligase family protein [Bacteroidales bacterium]|nr:amidoligase family protein [Bacteroidales bacterium]
MRNITTTTANIANINATEIREALGKSIFDAIDAVKAQKATLEQKRAALVTICGLREIDANDVIAQHAREIRANRPAPTPRLRFTFGVEIECYVAQSAITRECAERNVPMAYERYNHTDGRDHYKFVTDASVTGNGDRPQDGIECVTPILEGKAGRDSLKAMCESLNAAGATVNRNCGLHVHIGAADLSDEAYANVFANYMHLETVIDAFMAPSRRDNYYAQSLRGHRRGLDRTTTRDHVYRELEGCRYYKVNCVAYGAHKTIEFRQHQGSTDFAKIDAWVMFCGKLVEWSKSHRLTADVATIDDIEFLTAKEKRFFKTRAAKLNPAQAA